MFACEYKELIELDKSVYTFDENNSNIDWDKSVGDISTELQLNNDDCVDDNCDDIETVVTKNFVLKLYKA